MNKNFVDWVCLISSFFLNSWISFANDYWPVIECLCRGSPIHPFSVKGGRYDTECACSVLDLILIFLVLHVKDMSFDKQGASDVTDQQRKTRNRFTTTSFQKANLFCDHSGVLLSRAPLLQNKQVHVFSARHLIPQCDKWWVSYDPHGTGAIHSFNKVYRHTFLCRYREAGVWIKVFPIRMVGASPKAFSASEEMQKFFHVVCLNVILVETGVFSQWQCPMGAMRTPVTLPFHVGSVKVAGWSAWCWQSHTDLKNCKRQFGGLLWNWRFPSFRPVDCVVGVLLQSWWL